MNEDIIINFDTDNQIDISLAGSELTTLTLDGNCCGTTNYNALSNKPQINGVTLIGNKTSHEIKVQDEMDEITAQQIDTIIYG